MKNSLVIGVVLFLSSLCFAGQKSYNVIFASPATVSGVQLKAGEYKVKVDGTNAVFTDRNYKTVTAPVKVEISDKKFGTPPSTAPKRAASTRSTPSSSPAPPRASNSRSKRATAP